MKLTEKTGEGSLVTETLELIGLKFVVWAEGPKKKVERGTVA